MANAMANGKMGDQNVRQNAVKRQNAVTDGRHDGERKEAQRHKTLGKMGKRENQIMQRLFGTEGKDKFHSILSYFVFLFPFLPSLLLSF